MSTGKEAGEPEWAAFSRVVQEGTLEVIHLLIQQCGIIGDIDKWMSEFVFEYLILGKSIQRW